MEKIQIKAGTKGKAHRSPGADLQIWDAEMFFGIAGDGFGLQQGIPSQIYVGKEERESPGVSFSCQEFSPAWIQLLDKAGCVERVRTIWEQLGFLGINFQPHRLLLRTQNSLFFLLPRLIFHDKTSPKYH